MLLNRIYSNYYPSVSRVTWRNGSALDFESKGWGFESLRDRPRSASPPTIRPFLFRFLHVYDDIHNHWVLSVLASKIIHWWWTAYFCLNNFINNKRTISAEEKNSTSLTFENVQKSLPLSYASRAPFSWRIVFPSTRPNQAFQLPWKRLQ